MSIRPTCNSSDSNPSADHPPASTAGARAGVDTGWLLVFPGLALIAAALLLPAFEDLRAARAQQDVAESLLAWRQARVENYRAMADRLENPDDHLLASLVATQLNLVPADAEVLTTSTASHARAPSASPFAHLEPVWTPPAATHLADSILARWASSDRGRLAMLALGVVSVFVGLLPPARS